MILTSMMRLCAIIGLCEVEHKKQVYLDDSHLNSFSSKTAYRNSRLTGIADSSDYLSKCELIQSHTIFRHGTRFPSAKDMDKIEAVHKKIMKSRARSILPSEFQTWKLPFQRSKAKQLASVGYEEMMILGHNFRRRLDPILFHDNVTSSGHDNTVAKQIRVYSSSQSRSKMSAAAFVRSFLNDSRSTRDAARLVTESDERLRFFDRCPHYTRSVLRNRAAKTQYTRYKHGPELRRVVRQLQQRWKLTDVKLTPEDARALHVMCGFEIATNLSSSMRPHLCPLSPAGDGLVVCPQHQHQQDPRREGGGGPAEASPLCSLLEPHQLVALEYLADLKHYWTKAYGSEINWLQSCTLVSPLLQLLMEAARAHHKIGGGGPTANQQRRTLSQQIPRATFWFGHAETLLPVVALLGLFNQSSPPVSAATLSERVALLRDPERRFATFRAAHIVPFAGNLGLDLYHCPALAKDELSGYRVQVRVNEQPAAWPMANWHSHVSLEGLMKQLALCLADKYDHDAVCVRGMSASQLSEAHKRSDEL